MPENWHDWPDEKKERIAKIADEPDTTKYGLLGLMELEECPGIEEYNDLKSEPERRAKVIQALMCTPTRREAARAARVSERTVYNYLADADFRKEYRQATADANEKLMDEVARKKLRAFEYLGGVMAEQNEHTTDRIRAAALVLGYMGELRAPGTLPEE